MTNLQYAFFPHCSTKRLFIIGIERGKAPLKNSPPSPLMKGRGIKGEGLINNLSTNMLH